MTWSTVNFHYENGRVSRLPAAASTSVPTYTAPYPAITTAGNSKDPNSANPAISNPVILKPSMFHL